MKQALKHNQNAHRPILTVTADWFFKSISNWKRLPEHDFPLLDVGVNEKASVDLENHHEEPKVVEDVSFEIEPTYLDSDIVLLDQSEIYNLNQEILDEISDFDDSSEEDGDLHSIAKSESADHNCLRRKLPIQNSRYSSSEADSSDANSSDVSDSLRPRKKRQRKAKGGRSNSSSRHQSPALTDDISSVVSGFSDLERALFEDDVE